MELDATQLALINQKLDALVSEVRQNHQEDKTMWQDHENRLRFLEKTTTELSSRTTVLNLIQAAFTTIASAAAVVLGKQ